MDMQGLAGIDWGVVAVPETFVIDENGVVVFKHTGPISAEIAKLKILPLLDSGSDDEAAQQ